MINELIPSLRTPLDYVSTVKGYNLQYQQGVKKILSGEEISGDIVVCTTGSDGRLEKSPHFSPLELIIIGNGQETSDSSFQNELKKSLDIGLIELKDHESGFFSCESNGAFFPTRFIDLSFLGGSFQAFSEYKKRGYATISNSDKDLKRSIKKFRDSKLRDARKCLDTGISPYGETQQFDIDSGTLLYSLDMPSSRSTKHGHLRTVQYRLADVIMRKLIEQPNAQEMMLDLPQTTLDRIDYLYYGDLLGKFNGSEIDELKSAYKYALYWYHSSEEQFKQEGELEFSVNPGELRDVTEAIQKLASDPKKFS